MSIALLADMLHKERKSFSLNPDGSLLLTIAGDYRDTAYPVHIVPENHGLLRGEVWFPTAAEPIQQVESLCQMMNDRWLGITLGFHGETNRFFVGSLIDPEGYKNDLAAVAHACDAALPVCLRVGEVGIWNPELVRLAFMRPKSMGTPQ